MAYPEARDFDVVVADNVVDDLRGVERGGDLEVGEVDVARALDVDHLHVVAALDVELVDVGRRDLRDAEVAVRARRVLGEVVAHALEVAGGGDEVEAGHVLDGLAGGHPGVGGAKVLLAQRRVVHAAQRDRRAAEQLAVRVVHLTVDDQVEHTGVVGRVCVCVLWVTANQHSSFCARMQADWRRDEGCTRARVGLGGAEGLDAEATVDSDAALNVTVHHVEIVDELVRAGDQDVQIGSGAEEVLGRARRAHGRRMGGDADSGGGGGGSRARLAVLDEGQALEVAALLSSHAAGVRGLALDEALLLVLELLLLALVEPLVTLAVVLALALEGVLPPAIATIAAAEALLELLLGLELAHGEGALLAVDALLKLVLARLEAVVTPGEVALLDRLAGRGARLHGRGAAVLGRGTTALSRGGAAVLGRGAAALGGRGGAVLGGGATLLGRGAALLGSGAALLAPVVPLAPTASLAVLLVLPLVVPFVP